MAIPERIQDSDFIDHRAVFDAIYWRLPEVIEASLSNDSVPQMPTAEERRIAASTFDRAVRMALGGELEPHELEAGTVLDPSELAAGTLLLIDREVLVKSRSDMSAASRCLPIDYNFPTQISHYLNCSSEDLINYAALKMGSEKEWRPGKLVLKNPSNPKDSWEYRREAWFGIVVPTDKGNREGHRIASFKFVYVQEGEPIPHQSSYGLANYLHQPSIVGGFTLVERGRWSAAPAEYQHMRSVKQYPGAVSCLKTSVDEFKQNNSLRARFLLKNY